MENRTILTGIGIVLAVVAALSFGVYLQRGGLEDLGIIRTGFAQAEMAKAITPGSPDLQQNKVYRKKLRTAKTPRLSRDFEDLDQELIRFCRYLDEREYVKSYRLPDGTYRQFVSILNLLSANPPFVAGEAGDPYKLKLNQEHFVRVLGAGNVQLVLDILANETEMIESTMEIIFEWLTKSIELRNPEIRMTQKELYEYAAFFLNTLSGRAYLSRRDSKTRILFTYYCVLVVDRANHDKANRYNVDIKPTAALLMDDLMNYRNLNAKGNYIRKIRQLETTTS